MGCSCDGPGGCQRHQIITDRKQFDQCAILNRQPQGMQTPCLHLGRKIDDAEDHYTCYLHGECTIAQETNGKLPCCGSCPNKAVLGTDTFKRWRDPLGIVGPNNKHTDVLRNMLRGGSAFLVCGGPSLLNVDYMKLRERGVFSLGVNNVAGKVPVSAFVCSDPPAKFHHGIFYDPKVMKFLPTPKLRGRRGTLRIKQPNGEFKQAKKKTIDCPNVWGFERRSWLAPDCTWFTGTSAAWGNHDAGVKKTGQPKTVCTMLLGLRILQYLGARNIFLLGVDFYMDPRRDLDKNYAFNQHREDGACSSNNNIYRVVNQWLLDLKPIFEQFGFNTYNTYQESRLTAFPYVPFSDALEVCRSGVPEEPFDLQGWYEK